MCHLWQAIRMAQEVGQGLERSALLLGAVQNLPQVNLNRQYRQKNTLTLLPIGNFRTSSARGISVLLYADDQKGEWS